MKFIQRESVDSDIVITLVKEPKGYLTIPNCMTLNIMGELPNKFHRYMLKILLGWEISVNRESQEFKLKSKGKKNDKK